MYTVLIAEDEMLVRMGITVSVPWEKLDMRVISEVSDGQKALEVWQMKKPDILITDLSMPGLDGISLIKEIRKSGESCAVVVITCMDQFSLLHQAMELGVAAYLVKATMNMEDIECALQKAKAQLGAPRPHSTLDMAEAQQMAFHEYLLEQSIGLKELDAKGRRCGFPLLPSYHLLCAQAVSTREISWQLQKAMNNMLCERLRSQHVVQALQRDGLVILLFTRAPKIQEMGQRCDVYKQYIRESFSVEVCIITYMEPIPIAQLPQRLKHMELLYENKALFAAPVIWLDEHGAPVDAQVQAGFSHLREKLWTLGDVSFALRAIGLVDDIQDAFEKCDSSFQTILLELAALLWMQAGIPAEQGHALEMELQKEQSASAVLQFLEDHVVSRCSTYRAEICTVISYMVQHMGGDLSLKQPAALISMHPQYLSNLFKKEVGVSYSDFLCMIRLSQAKKMLKDSSLGIQHISQSCGFSDITYFCRKFKQLTGKTPGQWRRT